MKAKNVIAALLFSVMLAIGLVGCQQQGASSEGSSSSSEAAESAGPAEAEGSSDESNDEAGAADDEGESESADGADDDANASDGDNAESADNPEASDGDSDANGDGGNDGETESADDSGEQDDPATHVYKRTSMVYLDPVTVADDATATIVIESTEGFDNGDVGMNLTVTNKTDDMLRIECLEGDFTVGDDKVRLLGTGLFNPEEQDDMFLYVDSRRLSSPTAEAFSGVSGTLSAYNDTTGELIATYPFTL